ncbi:helix-turn-helix domain-containing protein [Streptomyces erythrochromogenes]|uniref:helix-turn-helix domain-containing protein n=1 Tax=Streptomyces erythrochromogenes TaxID=285574 RepID=UPI0038704F6C|nr:helix-turn-helix domain-containing protein [Streptomyces erythrochromogenes]WST98391.1 helix-turn-helix domain-containing protein [Streptomyces erythrochromogenes]
MTSQEEPHEGLCKECGAELEQKSGRGRRKTYCGRLCRSRAQRHRTGRPPQQADKAPRGARPIARSIAEELVNMALDLLDAEYEGIPLQDLMVKASAIARETECYTSAAVHDARLAGASWQEVARAAVVGETTARSRWNEAQVMRRMATRSRERNTLRRQAQPALAPARSAEGEPLAVSRASRQLAGALSYLYKESGLSIREVADNIERSPSYVSRILSVSRTPSWQVVCKLAELFGGDPATLRVLWENTQGLAAQPQDLVETTVRLNGALRGLHLSAGCPPAKDICEETRGGLDAEDIAEILDGGQIPTWEKTGVFISAVGGCPADFRPLWEAVYNAFLTACDPEPFTQHHGLVDLEEETR